MTVIEALEGVANPMPDEQDFPQGRGQRREGSLKGFWVGLSSTLLRTRGRQVGERARARFHPAQATGEPGRLALRMVRVGQRSARSFRAKGEAPEAILSAPHGTQLANC